MADSILHLGSNQGLREAHLAAARQAISERIGPLLQASSLYETAAWGLTEQPAFFNQALRVETELTPIATIETILDIERQLGRERRIKWGPRLIDIDLIFYDDLILESPTLIVPHPWMQDRRFVLAPLAEIIPDWVHPQWNKTVTQLLDECPDESEVKRI